MRYALGSRAALTASPQGLCGGLSESTLLANILKNPRSLKEFPFVDFYRQLDVQKNAARTRSSVPLVAHANSVSAKPSKSALALMTQSAVSSKSLDAFLETHYLAGAAPAERLEALDRGLLDLVAASTPNNLRTMMQYLARFWQCGLFGSRPLIHSARNQARYVLERALVVHPATEHANGGEQVGVPDLQKFEIFVTNFFEYLGVQHSADDELEELLLRLSAKSGTLAATMSQILTIPSGRISEGTMREFLKAFAASNPSRKNVEAIKVVLLNSQTGPAAVAFLLPYTQSATEVFDLLDVVDRSALRREVYEITQTQILQQILHLSGGNLALAFGFISRLQAEPGEGISPESINLILQTTLRGSNDSAVSQALLLGGHRETDLDSGLVAQAKDRLEAVHNP